MKKTLSIIGALVLVAAIAVPVIAHGPGWGRGGHMMGYWGGGPGYSQPYGPNYGNLTEEQRTELEKLERGFYDETAQIRSELWSKRGELNALLNTTDPDADKAKAFQKEISDLRGKLAEKQTDFDLKARKINPEGTFGRGYGMGYGPHMRGYGQGMGYGRAMGGFGPGSCWN